MDERLGGKLQIEAKHLDKAGSALIKVSSLNRKDRLGREIFARGAGSAANFRTVSNSRLIAEPSHWKAQCQRVDPPIEVSEYSVLRLTLYSHCSFREFSIPVNSRLSLNLDFKFLTAFFPGT